MASEQELKNNSPLQKEFQNLLEKDFKDRKLKENEIIKATVTEITKNFVVVDCKAKMEGMIPVEEFKNDDELSKLKNLNYNDLSISIESVLVSFIIFVLSFQIQLKESGLPDLKQLRINFYLFFPQLKK